MSQREIDICDGWGAILREDADGNPSRISLRDGYKGDRITYHNFSLADAAKLRDTLTLLLIAPRTVPSRPNPFGNPALQEILEAKPKHS